MSSSRSRSRLHVVCMIVIALLYVLSVPWYRAVDAPLRLWFGLPDWVAVAVLCYAAVAVVNAVAWFTVEMPDEPDSATDPKAAP